MIGAIVTVPHAVGNECISQPRMRHLCASKKFKDELFLYPAGGQAL